MSLARFALRTATVKALRGRTFAGPNVLDSEIAPPEDAAPGTDVPFVVVYTDECEIDGTGTDLLDGAGTCCLTLEYGVTTRAKNGGEWQIPLTDAGIELTIDAIERQIGLALGGPDNPWAELWRTLVMASVRRRSGRGAEAKDGVRFAGRQLKIDVTLPREPHPGRPLGKVWADFLALAAADDDLSAMVPLLTDLATGGATDWPEWRTVRAAYGMSAARADALLITPPAPAQATNPAIQPPTVDEAGPVPPVYPPPQVV